MFSELSKLLTPAVWAEALSYPDYRQFIIELLAAGKTTGPNQSDAMLNYTRMNLQRMQRIDKQFEPSSSMHSAIQSIKQPMWWVILTEAWCGDAAQNIPMLAKMASSNPLIELKLLWRDENTALMDLFLTAGGRSIPKLIALDASSMQLLGDWGPRPAAAQKLYMDLKASHTPFMEASTQLHTWYANNKGVDLQLEMEALITNWAKSQL
jgi:hypothetical protein